MKKEPDVQRWSWLLRDLIRQQRRSLRSIEQAVGWSNGYLSLILGAGPPALKVEQVLAVLRTIEVPARRYFAELYELPLEPQEPDGLTREEVEEVVEAHMESERQQRSQEAQKLREDVDSLLARLDGGLEIDRDRLARLVGDALRIELGRLAAGAPAEAPASAPAAPPEPSAKPRGSRPRKKKDEKQGEDPDHAR